jgi:hypothetical protein
MFLNFSENAALAIFRVNVWYASFPNDVVTNNSIRQFLSTTTWLLLQDNNLFCSSDVLHHPLTSHCPISKDFVTLPKTFTLQTAAAMFAETLEEIQRSWRLTPESRNCA